MTRHFSILGSLVIIAAGAAAFGAADMMSYVDALQGDAAARVDARRMLPTYGVDAVAPVLPLLSHADGEISKAAFDILWEIANSAMSPGREAEAMRVAQALLGALATDAAEAIRLKLLRLLAIGAPEGCDLAPIALLLGDAALGEHARTTLERIATTEARGALRDALVGADGAWARALVNSLGALRDAESLPAIAGLLASNDAGLRAAAARALAWTGDPAYADRLRRVAAEATPETQFDATDALLRYADAMAVRGGNWDRAMALFREVLESQPEGVLKDGALVGLGRFGDETVVAPILATLASAEDPRTRGACMVALEALKGPGPGKALVAAYPGLTGQAQVAMIAMFGRKGGAAVLPAILEAARSEEAELRQTALRALGICAEPGGVPVLAQAAVSGPDEERPLAVDALARAAQTLRERGRTDDAGRAYGALYEAAPTPELRQTALDGIIACPVAEAFDIVFRVGGELEPSALSPPAQIAMLGALAKVGRKGEAMELLDALTNQPLVGDGVAQLAASLAPLAGDMNVPQRLGFVTDWRVVGPFPFGGPGSGLDEEHVGEPKVDLAARYQVGDAEVAWQEVHSRDLAGIVSLHDVFGMVERRVCYAYTRIDVPEGGDAILRCGSDDGIKAWVNGEVVLNHDVDRGAQVDQDQAPCTLRAGTNELLVKISQGGGGWNFCLRFTTPDGRPLVSSPAR